MKKTAYLLVDTASLSITQEVIQVDQIIKEDSLIAEPGMIQHVSCSRSLCGVTIQHLKKQALPIFAYINNVLLFAWKIAFLIVAEDLISRVSTKQIATSQQVEKHGTKTKNVALVRISASTRA